MAAIKSESAPVVLRFDNLEGKRLKPPPSSETTPVSQWEEVPAKLEVMFKYDTYAGLGLPGHGPLVAASSKDPAFGYGGGGPYSEGVIDAGKFAEAIKDKAPIDFPVSVQYPGMPPDPVQMSGVYDAREDTYQVSSMNPYGAGRWTYEIPREALLAFAKLFPKP